MESTESCKEIVFWCFQVRDLSVAYLLVGMTYLYVGVLIFASFPSPPLSKDCIEPVRLIVSFFLFFNVFCWRYGLAVTKNSLPHWGIDTVLFFFNLSCSIYLYVVFIYKVTSIHICTYTFTTLSISTSSILTSLNKICVRRIHWTLHTSSLCKENPYMNLICTLA